jgi:hypothetical protein
LSEHPKVLHHAKARHRHPPLELAEALPILDEELIEQAAAGGVGERLEHLVHSAR